MIRDIKLSVFVFGLCDSHCLFNAGIEDDSSMENNNEPLQALHHIVADLQELVSLYRAKQRSA